MENIIKKAIEGGYRTPDFLVNESTLVDGLIKWGKYPLDSLFWQALGKACGWDKKIMCPCCNVINPDRLYWVEHHYHALRFHEINLTEGWNKAVEYLQEVIK